MIQYTESERKENIPFILKQTDGGYAQLKEQAFDESEEEPERKRAFICRYCSHVITFPDRAMEINGSHLHVFTNPVGIVFEIACFSSADGCVITGEPTMEFTWFPGFLWCYAVCSNCFQHLGWFYCNDGAGFFGLATKYIAENR